MYFKPIVLVCALATSHADCNKNTASVVLPQEPVKNEIMCAQFGMARIAQTALTPNPDEYVKILCERRDGKMPKFAVGEIQ